MKYLLIVSDSIIDDITERYPNIEIKPILRPMLVGEGGDSVYLSQPYLDVLRQKANEIELEEAIKNVRATMDMVREYEEWHSMNGVMKMPKGLFDKIYNEAKEDNDDI